MARYRIVCTTQTDWSRPGHGHITHVGTGTDPANASNGWTVDEVRSAIDIGTTFYVQNGVHLAEVGKYDCSCGIRTIKSHADGQWDNNLDSLRACDWK